MKKMFVLRAALVIVLAVAVVGPAFSGGGAEKGNAINLYADGSDNVRVVWEAAIKAFDKTNTGVTVNLQFLASGPGGQTGWQKLIAAYQAGEKSIDIDVMQVDENALTRIFKEASPDALLKLDPSKIPNLSNITAKSVVAPDRSMAYRGTAVFLAYNSDKVPNPPKTPQELYAWIKANPGKFAYNDPSTGGSGSSFVHTAVYNFLPPEALSSTDKKWESQWDQGFALLKELHPYLYKASGKVQYTVKNQGSLDLLASGEIWMTPAWADMTLDQKSKGLLPASIKLQQLDPSFTGSITSLAIPAMSQHIDAAYKFLNFCASVEAQDVFVTVMKAIPVIPTSMLPKATLDMLSGLQQASYRTETIGDLSTDLNQRWTKDIATLP